MIKQIIVKDMQTEFEDKKFIEQADKLVEMLFKSAGRYTSADGHKELLFVINADIETYLEQTFTGSYKQRLAELIQQEAGKQGIVLIDAKMKGTTELKLKGEEQ